MRSITILILSVISCTITANAQVNAEQSVPKINDIGHNIITFGDKSVSSDSAATRQKMVELFYFDQFRHVTDPLAPYFMFMSRDASLAMGVGGSFKIRGYYDWNGAVTSGVDFTTWAIDVPRSSYDSHKIGTSVSGSKLFFRLFGKSPRFGWYQLYLGTKLGSDNHLKLDKAYASVGDWTIGYAPSTFSDPMSNPSTVDPEGPNAIISHSNILIRYMHTFRGNHIVIAASAETPDDNIPDDHPDAARSANAFMPGLASFMQYQWQDGASHIRLSGIIRGLEYRDMLRSQNHKVIGWGTQISTISIFKPFTLFGAFNIGKGIGTYIQDLSVDPTDLQYCYNKEGLPDGRMRAPMSIGWYAALQSDWSPQVFSTIMFSEVRYFAKELNGAVPTTYKYGLYGAANIFWNPTRRAQLGLEYNIGCRKNIDGDSRWVNRIGIIAQYSF